MNFQVKVMSAPNDFLLNSIINFLISMYPYDVLYIESILSDLYPTYSPVPLRLSIDDAYVRIDSSSLVIPAIETERELDLLRLHFRINNTSRQFYTHKLINLIYYDSIKEATFYEEHF